MAEPESTRVQETGGDLFREPLSVAPDEVEKRFGAGRPKGSKNRSSEELALLVQQIGGHPVLAMARIAGMSIEQIKEMLGCKRIDAFDRWVNVLDKLAPYVASKQPLAVAVSGKVATLQLVVPLANGQAVAGPEGVAALFQEAARVAEKEGFALPAPIVESDDETTT